MFNKDSQTAFVQHNFLGWAELVYLGVPLSSIRMGTQISSAKSALFLMAIVWDVLLLQDYISPSLLLFCWESLGESLLMAIWLSYPHL